jgi:hypothetical protein
MVDRRDQRRAECCGPSIVVIVGRWKIRMSSPGSVEVAPYRMRCVEGGVEQVILGAHNSAYRKKIRLDQSHPQSGCRAAKSSWLAPELVRVALPGVDGPRDPWRILHELPPRPDRPRDRSKRLVDYLVDDPLDTRRPRRRRRPRLPTGTRRAGLSRVLPGRTAARARAAHWLVAQRPASAAPRVRFDSWRQLFATFRLTQAQ